MVDAAGLDPWGDSTVSAPLGIKGFSITGNPGELAALNLALAQLMTTKTGRYLINQLSESGVQINLIIRENIRLKNGKRVKGVTADLGFERDCNGDYRLKVPRLTLAFDLDYIRSESMPGGFDAFLRNVLAHELGHAYQDVFHPNDVIWGRIIGQTERYAVEQWERAIKVEYNKNMGTWPSSVPDRRPDIK